MEELAKEYRIQVERLLGGNAVFEEVHRWSERSSVIWRVRGPSGDYALKVHRSEEKYRQELEAYTAWLPELHGLAECVPRLRGTLVGEPGALLMSWIDGEMCDSAGLNETEEVVVYEWAGRSLAELHEARVPAERIAAHRIAIRRKIRCRAAALRDVVGLEVSAWASEVAERAGWESIPIGYCHRDFSPRNWMVSRKACGLQVSLLDFEHAEVDCLAMDVMKLWDGPFEERPDRRRAFYAGYGISEHEHVEAIRLVGAAHGLAVVAWSLRTGDDAYLQHGVDFMRRSVARERS